MRSLANTNERSYGKGDVTNYVAASMQLLCLIWAKSTLCRQMLGGLLCSDNVFFFAKKKPSDINYVLVMMCNIGISMLFYMLQQMATIFPAIGMNSSVYFVQRMTCVAFNTQNCLFYYVVKSVVLYLKKSSGIRDILFEFFCVIFLSYRLVSLLGLEIPSIPFQHFLTCHFTVFAIR